MQTAIINHYPSAIRNIREIQQIATSEDIEFSKLKANMVRILENMFILTADELGISRFENMLKIIPEKGELLEMRRARVLEKWYDSMPYSMSTLKKKLEAICRGQKFYIDSNENGMKIKTSIELGTESILQEIMKMMEEFLPMNMYYLVEGVVKRERKGGICVGSRASAFIKIKAGPGTAPVQLSRSKTARIATGTLSQVRVVYLPERG